MLKRMKWQSYSEKKKIAITLDRMLPFITVGREQAIWTCLQLTTGIYAKATAKCTDQPQWVPLDRDIAWILGTERKVWR